MSEDASSFINLVGSFCAKMPLLGLSEFSAHIPGFIADFGILGVFCLF